MPGWLAVGAIVIAVDVHASVTGRPTLSMSFRSASRAHRLLVGFSTSYLLAHLYGALPSTVDPLRRLGAHRLV